MLHRGSAGSGTRLRLITDQVRGADGTRKKNLLKFGRAACSVNRFFIFMERKRIFFLVTVIFCHSVLLQIIRKWLVAICAVAFWGTESKPLIYENKPYAVQKCERLPFSSKHEAMMLLEQEAGCALNPAATSFCLSPAAPGLGTRALRTAGGSAAARAQLDVLSTSVTP